MMSTPEVGQSNWQQIAEAKQGLLEAAIRQLKEQDDDIARLKHDLSWHYDEVAYLRGVIQKALNIVLRPPALKWPGDQHPVIEASQILSDALKPNRRQQ